MTPLQKLQLEQSEKREAINALLGNDDISEEQRTELGTLTERAQQIEVELRAAIVATPEPVTTTIADNGDAKAREFRALKGKVKLHRYVAAAMESRSVDGAEKEYGEALGLPVGHVPLSMFAPAEVRSEEDPEKRTETDTDTTTVPRPWVDRLFADTAAMGLGLTFESVAPGVASHPITTGGGTPAQRGREEAAAVGAWTIGVTELKPSRMAIHYRFAIEDAARLPGLEMALTRDMGMALRERMDRAIFAGDDGANENTADIPAISATAGITAKTLTQANKIKYDESLSAFVDLLDGLHAESLGDLNVVAYVGANKLWRSTIANATAENATIAQFLAANGLSWRTRGDVEEATTNGKEGAMIGLARGIQGAGVVATWEGATLIRDHYTGAASGQVQLTLCALWNYAVVRASNFAKLSFVT